MSQNYSIQANRHTHTHTHTLVRLARLFVRFRSSLCSLTSYYHYLLLLHFNDLNHLRTNYYVLLGALSVAFGAVVCCLSFRRLYYFDERSLVETLCAATQCINIGRIDGGSGDVERERLAFIWWKVSWRFTMCPNVVHTHTYKRIFRNRLTALLQWLHLFYILPFGC